MSETTDIVEKIKTVWDRKEFRENEFVQKIIFEKGPAINLWDRENIPKEAVGKFLTVTNVYTKANNKGYDEYNTTSNSIVQLSDSKNNESKPIKKMPTKNICPHCKKEITIIIQ